MTPKYKLNDIVTPKHGADGVVQEIITMPQGVKYGIRDIDDEWAELRYYTEDIISNTKSLEPEFSKFVDDNFNNLI